MPVCLDICFPHFLCSLLTIYIDEGSKHTSNFEILTINSVHNYYQMIAVYGLHFFAYSFIPKWAWERYMGC